MVLGEYENKYQKVSFDQMGPRQFVVHHESKDLPGIDGRTIKCEHFLEWINPNAYQDAEKMYKNIKSRMQQEEQYFSDK